MRSRTILKQALPFAASFPEATASCKRAALLFPSARAVIRAVAADADAAITRVGPGMPTRRSPLYLIFLTVFIDLVGFGIVIPVLPLYAKHFGATEMDNGWLVGIYSAMQFLAAPLLGKLSDRVGRRPVLLVSLIGTAVGFFIMGGARTLLWLFIARIIDGISGGNISTAQAYIADVTKPEERSKAMGMIGAAFGLGFVFGPAIGGVLAQISISAPFYFAGALAPENAATLREVFQHGWHLPILLGSYFFAITGFSIMTTNFALFTSERFGYDARHNGYIFAFIGVVGALMQGGVLRRILKIYREKEIAVAGCIALALGLALLPLSEGLSSLLVFTAIVGIGNSLITPTLNGLASQSADRQWQGRVIGLMQSAGSLARWVGPLLAGWLLAKDAHNPHRLYGQTPFWAAAAILIVALLFTLRLPRIPVKAES